MSFWRKQEDNKRLQRLYDETKNSCGNGAYYDRRKDRIIRYSLSNGKSYPKYLKRQSNKRIRKNKYYLPKRGNYKKLYDYWWLLY